MPKSTGHNGPEAARAARQERLAEQLRANLRRRKADRPTNAPEANAPEIDAAEIDAAAAEAAAPEDLKNRPEDH